MHTPDFSVLTARVVERVARDHKIYTRIEDLRGRRPHGYISRLELVLVGAREDPELGYWIALHEAGHAYHGDIYDLDRYNRDRFGNECRAWLWALEHTEVPPSPRVCEWIVSRNALGSYGPYTLDAQQCPEYQVLRSRLDRKESEPAKAN